MRARLPGWCRSGRDELQAMAALAACAPRYAIVAREAEVAFGPETAAAFDVVERLAGTATTDFGAPDVAIATDHLPRTAEAAARDAAIVAAAWRVFERVVGRAPASLAKGPRGGGRDRDRIVEHVLGAEVSYGRLIGVRGWKPEATDASGAAAFKEEVLAALRSVEPLPSAQGRRWPAAYAARRIAWHVIDHAWEIEDRGGLAPERLW